MDSQNVRRAYLKEFQRTQHELNFIFSYNQHDFPMSFIYDESVNFCLLEKEFGVEYMNILYLHIVAFEGNKVASLKPDTIEFGCFQQYVNQDFIQLWYKVYNNAWAQWKYENNEPKYQGPIITNLMKNQYNSIVFENSKPKAIVFSSGGKDSLVCLSLIDDTGLEYDTLTYGSTIYGEIEPQFERAQKIIHLFKPKNIRKQIVKDNFFNSNILNEPHIDSKTLLAAETPSSVFASIPFVLAHKYTTIMVGHERSANTGQLYWEEIKLEINHQWGKSFEAEQALNKYLQQNFIKNVTYCSLLQPIHDILIFALLNNSLQQVQYTNSCNMGTESCLRCPKCLYVYLGYQAFLPEDVLQKKFPDNLFDEDECLQVFEELMGLKNHLPFECIGQLQEIHFYLELCIRRHKKGKVLDIFKQNYNIDLFKILDTYKNVYENEHLIPQYEASLIIPKFKKISEWVIQYINQLQQQQQ